MKLLDKVQKPILRILRGKRFFYPKDSLFIAHTQNYFNSLFLIRALYAYSLAAALDAYTWMPQQYADKVFFAPLWVFGNLPPDQLQFLVKPLFWSWIGGSILAFFYFEVRLFRIIQALSLFYTIALVNSDGHFSNSSHAFVWISMLLVFLPSGHGKLSSRPSRIERHQLILWVWFLHLMVAMFYTMTGFWKVVAIVNCSVNPSLDCQLDRWILTNFSAREAIFYNHFGPWRDVFYQYPWVSFFSYMGTIWIHVVSLYFAFRLDLHRVFGFLRLIFHLGTFLFFGINFSYMAVPVGLLFLLSPFARSQSPRRMLTEILSLPPMSWFLPRTGEK